MYLQADAVICGFVGEVPKALGNKTAAAERSGAVGRPSKAGLLIKIPSALGLL